MWYGCSKGGELSIECVKLNFGGLLRIMRNKCFFGYIIKFGVVKFWFDLFF